MPSITQRLLELEILVTVDHDPQLSIMQKKILEPSKKKLLVTLMGIYFYRHHLLASRVHQLSKQIRPTTPGVFNKNGSSSA